MTKLTVALLTLFATPFVLAAQNRGQNLSEDFRVTTTLEGSNDTAFISGHAIASADKLRMDVTTRGENARVSPLGASDKVGMIVSDTGKTITYIDDKNSSFVRVKPAEMLQQMQQMGGMQMNFSGTQATVDSLGPGPAILGHPTAHYRVNTGMTMSMSAMGQQQSMQISSVTEYYYATDLRGTLNPFESLSGGDMVNMLGSSNKDFSDKMKAAKAKLPQGTPLRVANTATIVMQGQTRVTDTKAEVTSVQWVPADAKTFEVPATYKEESLPSMTGGGAPPPAQ